MQRLMLIPLFLTVVFLPSVAVCEETGTADSSTFQWVNENGTVSFTDDPMRIPARELKKARRRASVTGQTATRPVPQGSPAAAPATQLRPMQYGGHGEAWWRGRFAGLRSQIQAIKDAVPHKEVRLKELHFKKVASNCIGMSPGVSGNPRKNKVAYLSLHNEITTDKERLANLERELEDLRREASSIGVPSSWQ